MSGRKFYLIDECHNYIILKLVDIYKKTIYQISRKNELFFEEICESNIGNIAKENSLNVIITNPMNSFFVYVKNENQVVETKNDKNIFSNGSTIGRVGPFFDYIKRYISTIKSYFDYFIERKYKCRIFAT